MYLQLIFWCFSFDTENLLPVPAGVDSTARSYSLVNGIIETPVGWSLFNTKLLSKHNWNPNQQNQDLPIGFPSMYCSGAV